MRIRVLYQWSAQAPLPGVIIDLDDTPELRARIAGGHAEEVTSDTPITAQRSVRVDPELVEDDEAGYGPGGDDPNASTALGDDADADAGAEAAGYSDPVFSASALDLISGSVSGLTAQLQNVDDLILAEEALTAEREKKSPRMSAMNAIATRIEELKRKKPPSGDDDDAEGEDYEDFDDDEDDEDFDDEEEDEPEPIRKSKKSGKSAKSTKPKKSAAKA